MFKKKYIDTLERRIPFNKSVKRKVVIAFESTCEELGISSSNLTEQLLLSFIQDIHDAKHDIKDQQICLMCGKDKLEK